MASTTPQVTPGTNTYLVMPPCDWCWPARSTLLPAILVDAGDAREDYTPFLEAVLRGTLHIGDAKPEQPVCIAITDMYVHPLPNDSIATHWHHDHVGGIPFVLRMLETLRKVAPDTVPVPRVHKYPEPVTDSSFFERMSNVNPAAYAHSPGKQGLEAVLWPLRDNQTLRVADPDDASRTSSLRVLYTPGHAMDHVCLLLEEDNVLLTGDNVLGSGSTVFEDLNLYLRSLQRAQALLSARPASPLGIYATPALGSGVENVLYPGHGPVIPRGRDTLRRYLSHRVEREAQLLALLLGQPGDKRASCQAVAFAEKVIAEQQHLKRPRATWTLSQFVEVLYENYAMDMYPAVARGLHQHLKKLCTDPDALPKPPFLMHKPIPATPWAAKTARVRAVRVPSYQYSDSAIPDAPRTDADWWELLEIPWMVCS